MRDEFDELLAETGIALTLPAGFEPFPVRDDCKFRYQRAYRDATGVELRVRIDSLRWIREGPVGFVPANFSESAFVAGVTNLGGGEARGRQWDDASVRRFFCADWLRSAYFRPADPSFAPDHELAAAYFFHREGIADVYLIGLYSDGVDIDDVVLGRQQPLRFPDFPAERSEDYLAAWREAVELIEGCVNLDGRPLPPPTDEERARLEASIRLFRKAAEMEPNNAGPPLFIGKVYERLGDVLACVNALRKAHALVPEEAPVLVEFSTALRRCGRYGEAVEVLEKGLRIHPGDPRLHFNLGMAHLMRGESRLAAESFEKLVALEPEDEHNQRLLALATADVRAHEYRDGIRVAEDARLAFECFEEARLRGLAFAAMDVAWCHFWGLGTARDPARSAALLSELIDRCDERTARIALAAQYALGAGVPRDEEVCVKLLAEGESGLEPGTPAWHLWLDAWNGGAESQYHMARWCDDSLYTWGHRERARWLRMAAEAGVPDAQYEFARYLETMMEGPQGGSYRSAASNWKWRAAHQNHARAFEELREAGDGLWNMMDDP